MGFLDSIASVASVAVPGVAFVQDVSNRGINAITKPSAQTIGNALLPGVGGMIGAGYDYLNDKAKAEAAATQAYNDRINGLIAGINKREGDVQNYLNEQTKAMNAQIQAYMKDQADKAAAEQVAQAAANQRALETKEALKAQSTAFDAAVPSMIANMGAEAGTRGRQSLEQGLKNVDRSANARGLLYGGISESAKAGLRSQTAADLAAQQQYANQAVGSQADAYRALASQNTRDNDASILNQYQQNALGAQNVYSQGLAARNALTGMNKGVNALYGANTNIVNQAQGNEKAADNGFQPALYGAAGQLAGAGINAGIQESKKSPAPTATATVEEAYVNPRQTVKPIAVTNHVVR